MSTRAGFFSGGGGGDGAEAAGDDGRAGVLGEAPRLSEPSGSAGPSAAARGRGDVDAATGAGVTGPATGGRGGALKATPWSSPKRMTSGEAEAEAEAATLGAAGATTIAGGTASTGGVALVSVEELAAAGRASGPSTVMTSRDASTAKTAPIAAAPITQAAFGRSRTTITVGDGVRSELTGATEPGSPAPWRAMGIIELERRTNAGSGGEDSRATSVIGAGARATLVVRTNGGGLTDGRREAGAEALAPSSRGAASGGGGADRAGGAGGGGVTAARTRDEDCRSRDAAAIAERHSPATPCATLSSMMRRETLAVTRRGRAVVGGSSGPRRGPRSTRGIGGVANEGGGDSTRTRSSSSSSISSPAFFRFENGSKSSQLPFPYP